MYEVIDVAFISFDTTFRLFAKHLERFLHPKFKFKDGGKSIGAFEKHADGVVSGGSILRKISEAVSKKKTQSQGDSTTKS